MAEALAYEAPPRREGKDPTALTRTLVIWLGLALAGSISTIVTDAQEVWALSTLDPNAPMSAWSEVPSMGAAVDALVALASLFQFVVYVGAVFMSARWIYRAAFNARVLSRKVTVSPAWAVGWYFVPIANLWKPFRAMKEAWATGTRPDAWTTVETPAVLRWWWGLWLVNNTISNVSFRLWVQADTASDLSSAAMASLVSEVVNIPLFLIFIWIVKRVASLQQAALQRREFD